MYLCFSKKSENLRSSKNSLVIQNFQKIELKILSIRIIRIIRKKSQNRLNRFFGQRINSRSAHKKAQILKMSTSRRRYIQIPGNSVSVSLRYKVSYGSHRPARPPKAQILRPQPQKKNSDVVAHRRACLLEFRIKFSGVSLTQKMSFQTQEC